MSNPDYNKTTINNPPRIRSLTPVYCAGIVVPVLRVTNRAPVLVYNTPRRYCPTVCGDALTIEVRISDITGISPEVAQHISG